VISGLSFARLPRIGDCAPVAVSRPSEMDSCGVMADATGVQSAIDAGLVSRRDGQHLEPDSVDKPYAPTAPKTGSPGAIVQPSANWRIPAFPALIIGSTVNVMPVCNFKPVRGRP
jgi:hypothetical protein